MKTIARWVLAIGTVTAIAASPTRAYGEAAFFRVVAPTTTVIKVFSANGMLVWSNAAVGGTGRIQRATTLTGVSNWVTFAEYTATSRLMTLPTAYYLIVDLSAGPTATSYPVTYLTTAPAGGWTDEYKTTKLVLQRIQAKTGAFTMGSPSNELGHRNDEPQHQVTLTQPFYIGVFEITQKQWERIMGDWPSYCNDTRYRDSRPVEQVTYNAIRGATAGAGWPAHGNVDADSFMGRLRARTGKAFDLPTEAQWEYACRAGTTTALNSGKNLTDLDFCPNMDDVGRYSYNGGSTYSQTGDTSTRTAKVGSYLPNAWGLYDMHGNVFEWCLDWYGYPDTGSDPKGPVSGTSRVERGGSCYSGAISCRVAYRARDYPDGIYSSNGVRVVVPASQP